MTILFSLDNKPGRNYERADKLKRIHQVIHEDAWLIDGIAVCVLALTYILIKSVSPLSGIVTAKIWLLIPLAVCIVCFVHSALRIFYKPDNTYKKICGILKYPVIVNDIELCDEFNEQGRTVKKLYVRYSVTEQKPVRIGLFMKKRDKVYFLSYLKTDSICDGIRMVTQEDEIARAVEALGIKASDLNAEVFVAKFKKTSPKEGECVSSDDIDDSVIVYDILEAAEIAKG
ncbi:MAG: hypothetical protein LUE12_02695 [Ruminococcus sp.]|nr:hypothetical protein [Ruminococcus sp.]